MIPITSQISIAGMGKSGKTYFAKNHIIKNISKRYHIMVYDPLGEYKKTREDMDIYVPKPASTKDFNQWIKEVYKKGNTFAVCEQAELYLPTRLNLAKYPHLQLFIQSARHRKCGGVFISRRFACLSTTVVALSDYVYLFRMFSPSDLRQASMYIHDWRRLPTLRRGQFFQFSDRGEKLCKPIKKKVN